MEPELPDGWRIVFAAKEPWHRAALGYEGRGAPKDSDEYLWCYRDGNLVLNLIDAARMEYIPEAVVNEAIDYLAKCIGKGEKTLVVCDQGNSRAPAIALLFMATRGFFTGKHLEAAISQFRDTVYPSFEPGLGMKAFLDHYWWSYNR